MRKILGLLAAASMVTAPGAQAQGDATAYAPSGPWALDYGDDYCRLGRVFSNGRDDVEVAIERIRPGPQVRLWVVGDSIRTFRGSTETGYTFLPSQTERTAQPIRASRGSTQVMSLPELTLAPFTPPAPGAAPAPPPPYDPAGEREVAKGITGIALGKGLTRPVRFETGSLEEPIAALQTCTDDLVASWGIDPEKHKSLSAPAIPQDFPWLPTGTIGFGDFGRLAGNTNQVRLVIDANGKPTSCHIAWPTLSADQNEKICQAVMEKASFMPARDAGGQAIASYWMGSPMFMMPGPGGARR